MSKAINFQDLLGNVSKVLSSKEREFLLWRKLILR